jgi:RNA polymerase sigma-70 factor, ECF subfamily
MVKSRNGTGAGAPTLAAALAGDEAAFTALAERHRRELQVHCYRMLGSFNDSEDMVQETLLRAWRGRQTFQGRSSLRAWLYGIATNACLDFLAENPHRVLAEADHAGGDRAVAGRANGEAARPQAADAPPPSPDVPWLQPYPDRLLEAASPREAEPEAAVAVRETIGIAFLVAVQFLPAKPRAALILCDVLDWSAKEAGELLDLSVAAVNSALQRARATLHKRQPERERALKPGHDADEQQRALLERYVAATERGDAAGLAKLLRDDVRFSMPPAPGVHVGRDTVVAAWVKGGFGSDWFGEFRCVRTGANRMPAVACYVRKPGAGSFHPMAIDLLQIEDGLITEITTFPLESMVRTFDLPAKL